MASPKKVVSDSAMARVLALQAAALKAAQTIIRGDGYSDFFVEGPDVHNEGPGRSAEGPGHFGEGGGRGSWHEAFGDSGAAGIENYDVSRMVALHAMGLAAAGYSDFFVEGGGGSWHEAFNDSARGNAENIGQLMSSASVRARALSKLTVVQAYAILKAGKSREL